MYLLDSNVFIEAKNRYYAFDIAPVFWSWLDELFSGDARIITNVRDEILDGSDELADWMKVRKDEAWILDVDDEKTQLAFTDLANEVSSANYKASAINDFLSRADPWIVAKAQVEQATIVTHEQLDLGARRKIPLPNPCQSRAITCLNTFDFLRLKSKVFT